jgi:hypothetical protein
VPEERILKSDAEMWCLVKWVYARTMDIVKTERSFPVTDETRKHLHICLDISVAAYTYVSASLTNIQTIGNSVFEKKETREVKRRTEHHTYRNMLITLKRVF